MSTSKVLALPRPDAGAEVEVIRANDWSGISEPTWLFDGLLPARSLALLSGESGSLKTWLGLELSLALTQAQPFLGFSGPRAQVLYVNGEDGPSLIKSRLEKLARFRGLSSWPGLDLVAQRVDLDEPEERDRLTALVREQGYSLLVIDTLASCFPSAERSVSALIAWADDVKQAGATLLIVHHLRKTPAGRVSKLDASDPDNIRGSSGIRGACDVILVAAVEERLRLRVTKHRYLERGLWPDLTLRIGDESEVGAVPAMFEDLDAASVEREPADVVRPRSERARAWGYAVIVYAAAIGFLGTCAAMVKQ